MVFVAFSLGSNLGDRNAYLTRAIEDLRTIVQDLRVSDVIETEPFGVQERQPPYLNMAAVGKTDLPPSALMGALLDIERRHGRIRTAPNASRTLDVDLILYGAAVLDEPGLVVPHPRFRERRFVLEPLAALAPFARDPVTGLMIQQLVDRLPPADAPNRKGAPA